jgi:hydrogenase-4 component A
VSGVKQELLDFFVRQGISVSGEMVRVRQLGLCIDCKLCEEACEERYGARRLTLGGLPARHARLHLHVPHVHRSAVHRSVRVRLDQVRPRQREVVINESTCTGCTACAQACPYGAIDMIEVEPDAPTFKKDFKARLEKQGALSSAPARRASRAPAGSRTSAITASRYGDQACVSACPTGSLIEINAYDLFRERRPKMAQLAQPASTPTDQEGPQGGPAGPAVHRGRRVRSGGIAKVKRGRYAPLLFWMVGIFAFLVALGEACSRVRAEQSYRFSQLARPELRGLRRAS